MVVSLQIALLKRQMEKAATPSTKSRIAYQGIVIAALGDGLLLFALIALLMIDEAAFLTISSAAFLACIHVAFLEVKFVFDIWTVQVGDPARAEQERQRRTAPAPATVTAIATATAPAVGTPIPLPAPPLPPPNFLEVCLYRSQPHGRKARLPSSSLPTKAAHFRPRFPALVHHSPPFIADSTSP